MVKNSISNYFSPSANWIANLATPVLSFQVFSSVLRILRTSLAVNDCGRPMMVKTEKRCYSAYAYWTRRSVSLENFELYINFQVNIKEIFYTDPIGYLLNMNISIWHPLFSISALFSTCMRNWRILLDLEQFNRVWTQFSGRLPHVKQLIIPFFCTLFPFPQKNRLFLYKLIMNCFIQLKN